MCFEYYIEIAYVQCLDNKTLTLLWKLALQFDETLFITLFWRHWPSRSLVYKLWTICVCELLSRIIIWCLCVSVSELPLTLSSPMNIRYNHKIRVLMDSEKECFDEHTHIPHTHTPLVLHMNDLAYNILQLVTHVTRCVHCSKGQIK